MSILKEIESLNYQSSDSVQDFALTYRALFDQALALELKDMSFEEVYTLKMSFKLPPQYAFIISQFQDSQSVRF